MTVRTRVAPSPTGDPHLGTAYMALFNCAFAKKHGGQFVLRIEDTDQARSTTESEQVIFDALRWMGLEWDEGPDIGGPYGPYRQSDRLDHYTKHAAELVEGGHAFHCFCSKERLAELRRAQQSAGETPRYDGHCIGMDESDKARRVESGEVHVIRLRVPDDGECTFEDGLRGAITIPWQQVDMQVLVKSDGFPTYHLAVVVDDHQMDITHVLRGEEWISSVPKHVLLYQYFGWDMPSHYHLPLLRNSDQTKMSKRRNPTSINYYQRCGYLPEALLNYLALMGWSMPDEREIFGFDEMVEALDVDRMSTGAPVFDTEKLNWLNGQYIRGMSSSAFMDRVADWAVNRERLTELVPLIQERTERFIDLLPQVDYLLGERAEITQASFAHKDLGEGDCLRILDHTLRTLERMRSWQRDDLFEELKSLAEAMDVKFRDFLFPLFVAVSGREVSLPLFDSMAFLGSDLTRTRIRTAIDALGGLSKKETRRLERAFQELDG
jgi:glutamyl-tRNA synthetase